MRIDLNEGCAPLKPSLNCAFTFCSFSTLSWAWNEHRFFIATVLTPNLDVANSSVLWLWLMESPLPSGWTGNFTICISNMNTCDSFTWFISVDELQRIKKPEAPSQTSVHTFPDKPRHLLENLIAGANLACPRKGAETLLANQKPE